jgi:hypothetical protein
LTRARPDRLRARPDDLVLRCRSLNHTADPELAARVQANYRDTLGFVRGLYEQAHAHGLIESGADPRALAWLFLAIGAALDQAQLLQLGDELSPEVMARIGSLLHSGGHLTCPLHWPALTESSPVPVFSVS